MRPRLILSILSAIAAASAGAAIAQRSDAFGAPPDHPAIAYTTAPVADPASRLNKALEAGTAKLAFDPATGYLPAVLDALKVPVESQVLVFSQTSFQAPQINEKNPRAIYFNDQVAVGWVRGGDVLEVSAQDPRQGTIFYTLTQQAAAKPVLERNDRCLQCHLTWDTRAVPGPFVLTTYARKSDDEYANGGLVDDRDPIAMRWGGWYVTGKQVPKRHMGNRAMIRPDAADPEHTPPAPVFASLDGHVDLKGYLSTKSDVVALLVLEHQSHLTNLITRADWEARLAETRASRLSDTRLSPRVEEAIDEMVDYMLFVDEAPLPSPVAGSSGFAERFAAQGPKDPKGRSLRDLDLTHRLLRYPLSYMIYTPAFDALPDGVKARAYTRLWAILSGEAAAPKYAHLTRPVRQAIVEILQATKPGLPPFFKAVSQ